LIQIIEKENITFGAEVASSTSSAASALEVSAAGSLAARS
jgi:hypothetical protein